MAPYSFSGVIQVSGSPETPNWSERHHLNLWRMIKLANTFSLAAKMKISALQKYVKNIF